MVNVYTVSFLTSAYDAGFRVDRGEQARAAPWRSVWRRPAAEVFSSLIPPCAPAYAILHTVNASDMLLQASGDGQVHGEADSSRDQQHEARSSMKVDTHDHKVSLVYGDCCWSTPVNPNSSLQQPLLPKSACMKQASSVYCRLWRSSLSASVS
jgi:hypothetical protein